MFVRSHIIHNSIKFAIADYWISNLDVSAIVIFATHGEIFHIVFSNIIGP